MGRPKDQFFWDRVDIISESRWECQFCKKNFSGGASRIKAHLAKVKGEGIQICEGDVDRDTMNAAKKALHEEADLKGKGVKRRRPMETGTTPAPIDPMEEDLQNILGQSNFDNVPLAGNVNHASGLPMELELSNPCDEPEVEEGQSNAQAGLSTSNRIVELGRVNSEGRVTDADPTSSEIQSGVPIGTQIGRSTDFKPDADSAPVSQQDLQHSTSVEMSGYGQQAILSPENAALSFISDCSLNTSGVNRIVEGLSTNFEPNAGAVQVVVVTQQNTRHSTSGHFGLEPDVESPGNDLAALPIDDQPFHAESNIPPTNTGDIHENKMMPEHNEPMQVERDSGNAWERSQPSSSYSSVAMESRRHEIFELAPHTVGRDQIVDEICHSLTDKIPCIGVYGMGGVGKTTIMKHMHDKVRGDADFGEVLWVTVSQDCSLHELQNKLSMALKVTDDFRTIDIVERPTFLNGHLRERGKTLIILDDLWQHYNLNELGIKLTRDGGIQLVLTTRHQDVCQRMMCEKEFEVKCLPDDDAMNLFEKTLGYEMSDSRKGIAKDIIGKCRGLPLAIVVIAAHMRGVDNDHGWHSTLERLRHPEEVEPQHLMGKEVFPILLHSYSHLDETQQQCFLRCALYPEDSKIPRHQLIELYIDEGVIRKDSRWKMYNEANHILDELEKKCLLEKAVDGGPLETDEQGAVRMHDVIRDMALHIMNSKGTCIVKCHIPLDEIPVMDDGSGDLQKVSFVHNIFMNELPSLRSNCPQLSTLLVGGCENLSEIPECFFERTEGLKVIDMSSTSVATVPGSIPKLEILNALILRGCCKLISVPSLATLTSLKKLDLGDCELIVAIPDGLNMLVNLTYLDLSCTSIEEIMAGVIGKLHKLQYLGLGYATVHGKEVAALKKLEILHCRFKDVNELSDYAQHRQHEATLKAYTLLIADDSVRDWKIRIQLAWKRSRCLEEITDPNIFWRWGVKVVILGRGRSAGETFHIPSDVTALNFECGADRSCNNANFTRIENLETLIIWECSELFPVVLYGCRLTKLKRLDISLCKEVKSITGRAEEAEETVLEEGAFTLLRSISITACPKIKHVVGPELLPRLRNLHSIDVYYCENTEEVIAMPSRPPPLATPLLPLLTSVDIWKCPKMRRALTLELFMHLPNLESILVMWCERMKEVIGHESEHGIDTISNRDACMLPPSVSSRKLLDIYVSDAPELESISHWTHIRSFIRVISIKRCPKLKSIPFLDGFPSAPPFLEKLVIDSYQQWESMEWEHPEAKHALEPSVFIGKYCDGIPIEAWRVDHQHLPTIEGGETEDQP